MPGIVQTALSNAVLVTVAAPLVWAVARLARRPVLTHALWLIVLFKLLTPPLWVFPVQLPQSQPKAAAPVVTSVQPVLTRIVPSDLPGVVASSPYVVEPSAGETPPFIFATAPQAIAGPTSLAVSSPAAPSPRFDWRPWLVPAIEIIWALGAALCLLVAAIRTIRFSRALRWAGPSPAAAQARVDALARLLRLGPAPRVQFIPGTLCPMLWPIGRWPRLLIPRALWDRLDPIQRDTVLLHELAHWARRDHWVRWIELLATSLYWWLPACWWARRELRRAEEQCCDAWVLWAMPGTFHNYANALLEAVEFVSVRADRPSASIAVPALASGMGQFSDLKGRLTMLKHGNVSRALSWGGMAAVFGLGALLLPISPTVGQDAPRPGPALATPPADPASGEGAPGASSDPQREEYIQALRASQKQIEELTRELRQAQDRLMALRAEQNMRPAFGVPGSAPGPMPGDIRPDAGGPPLPPAAEYRPAGPGGMGIAPVPNSDPRQTNPSPDAQPGQHPETFRNWAATPGMRILTRTGPGEMQAVVIDPKTGVARNMRPDEVAGQNQRLYWIERADQGSPSDRLDKLEAELHSLMKEIHEIRAQSSAPRGFTTPPGMPAPPMPPSPGAPPLPSPTVPPSPGDAPPSALPPARGR
jgi:beta-lactamase regulating signal transducer with metallopeptidase domain